MHGADEQLGLHAGPPIIGAGAVPQYACPCLVSVGEDVPK